VRELKGLLDEKEEKIDVLSRIRSYRSPPLNGAEKKGTPGKAASSPESIAESTLTQSSACLRIVQPVALVGDGKTGSYYAGSSSTRPLIRMSPKVV
jgi:hypothetical protein